MKLSWRKKNFKFLSLSSIKKKIFKNILVLSVWQERTVFSRLFPKITLFLRVKANKHFDTRIFDKEIARLAPDVAIMKQEGDFKRIAFLATEMIDMGGHTKCLRDLAIAMFDCYESCLFLTQIDTSYDHAPKAMKDISQYSSILGQNINLVRFNKKICKLFMQIIEYNPKVIFSFIHPNDIAGAMILYLIKTHTKSKVLYCPHASHYPNLGMSFADLILEGMPVTAYITQNFRKIKKTHVMGILSKAVGECPNFFPEEIFAKRRDIGIKDSYQCTMSGGASYKFFDTYGSEYFRMIKKLLERNLKVQHVILSEFNEEQQNIIQKIFNASKTRERLLILPFSTEYELIFKCADVFIDSFPVSSALTQIDLMRLQVPSVVKINRENAFWSFHEYQKTDYPYMFEKVDDILKGVERLLLDKAECLRIVSENYLYYLNNYEGYTMKQRLCNIIEHADCLEQFYDRFDESISYTIKGINI